MEIGQFFFMGLFCGGFLMLWGGIAILWPGFAFKPHRTKLALINQQTYDFAQRYSGKIRFIGGLAIMLMGLIGEYFPLPEDFQIPVVIVATVLVSVGGMLLTDRELKQRFDEEGNPRDGA